MEGSEPTEVRAKEVLVLDSSTFIREAGLTSRGASALKHYLYHRGTRLVVPEIAAEEYERHLIERAKEKKKEIEKHLVWLSRFFGSVSGWPSPSDDAIEERAKMLANAEHLGAIILPETEALRERAEARSQAGRPPSHKRPGLNDCRIWEHCLALLADHDVVFVSGDKDFRKEQSECELHPKLQSEAQKAGTGLHSLTFHPNMASLLSELRAERPSIPKESVFAFVYDALADVKALESNSGCRPTATGDVKQTLFTTDQVDILEVRLEVDDKWGNPDGTKVYDFRLRGSCHYRLANHQLCDFTVSSIKLLIPQPDGSVRAVEGSRIYLRTDFSAGIPPIKPKPEILK